MKPVDIATVVLLIRNEIGRLLHVNQGPKGDKGDSIKGDKGKDGVSVKSIRENPITRQAIITLDDGQQFSFKLPRNGKDAKRPPPPKVFHGKDGTGIREIDVSDKGSLIFNLTDGRTLFKPLPVIHANAGKDGTKLIHGYKAPRSDIGNQGDWYLDRANGDWWEKSDSWNIIYKNKRASYGGYSDQMVREVIASVNPFSGYHLSDEDSPNPVKYYGYVRENGADWYILRIDSSTDPITYRYTVNAADYATAWTNRATLAYSNLQEVDIA